MRSIALVVALAGFQPGMVVASGLGGLRETPYQASVSDSEWSAAIPLRGSGIRLRLRSGPAPIKISQPRPGKSAQATVSIVVRADGTVGVYRVVETNDPSFARDFTEALPKERFEPPLVDGKPVSVRTDRVSSIAWDR